MKFIYLIFFTLISCTHSPKINNSSFREKKIRGFSIRSEEPICPRHPKNLSLSLRHITERLESYEFYQGCLENYFKINKPKEMLIRTCGSIKVSNQSKFQQVKLDSTVLPDSLRWCMEQQLWSYQFGLFGLNNANSVMLFIGMNWIVTPRP